MDPPKLPDTITVTVTRTPGYEASYQAWEAQAFAGEEFSASAIESTLGEVFRSLARSFDEWE